MRYPPRPYDRPLILSGKWKNGYGAGFISAADEGEGRRRDEQYVERSRAQHVEGLEGSLAEEEPEEDEARQYSEAGGEGAQKVQLPRGKKHTDGDRYGALEDHGSRDVPDGQGVFVVPEPDHGVELLRELGGQGREDQRDEAGGYTDGLREVLHGSHEEVGPESHHRDHSKQLRGDGPGRRPGAGRPEREPLRDIAFGLTTSPYGHYHVEDVGTEERDGQQNLH